MCLHEPLDRARRERRRIKHARGVHAHRDHEIVPRPRIVAALLVRQPAVEEQLAEGGCIECVGAGLVDNVDGGVERARGLVELELRVRRDPAFDQRTGVWQRRRRRTRIHVRRARAARGVGEGGTDRPERLAVAPPCDNNVGERRTVGLADCDRDRKQEHRRAHGTIISRRVYSCDVATLDRYELLRPLARGGMADVFLARRRVAGLEKRLVIKRLRRDHRHDPRFLDMFVREAQLSMSLVHQNIVPVFDFGRIGEDVFIAMEHIAGKDLGSTLACDRGSGMPPLLAAFIAHECCEALEYAHRRPEGAIHRDVTPRNVLLSWAGEVKLTDFGIAAVVDEVAGAFGTPGYMAPEQANAQRCDGRVDVYALGVVLWEALIGQHVRPTGDRVRTLDVARSGELPPMSESITPALAAIITRATARAPDERFASAREMANALDAYIVAKRARDGAAKPNNQLADWLRARWGDEQTDASAADAPVIDDAFVTFLDHGADGVRGSRTERSAADTALPPPPASAQTPPRSRRRVVAVVAAALGLTIAAGAALRGRDDGTPVASAGLAGDGRADAWTEVDAPPRITAAPQVDASSPSDATLTIDAERIMSASDDAGPRLAAPVRASKSIDAAVATPSRPFTIGADPWAYFTVDGSPVQHETPETLELSVGAHRITFSNPQLGVTRTVTIDVQEDGEPRHVERMR